MRIKDGCNELYGVDNVFQLERCKEKSIRTCREKYNCDFYTQTKEAVQRRTQTCLERYGKEHPSQVEEFKEKKKITCLNNYGVDHPLKSDEIKKRAKQTCNEHFGVDYPQQSLEVRQKTKATYREHYGVDHPLRSKEILEKITQTLYQNDTTRTSKPQLQLYELLSSMYDICELNYPCGVFSLDCMIQINGIKIDVEYDGEHWHQDNIKDIKRDKVIQSNGYKTLRIKGNYQIPTEQQINEAVQYLMDDNHKYTVIILDVHNI